MPRLLTVSRPTTPHRLIRRSLATVAVVAATAFSAISLAGQPAVAALAGPASVDLAHPHIPAAPHVAGAPGPRPQRVFLHAGHAAEPGPGHPGRDRQSASPQPVRQPALRAVLRAWQLRHASGSADLPGRLLHPGRPASAHRLATWSSTARLTCTTSASRARLAPRNCIALDNFWRSLSNLTIAIAGGSGCQTKTGVLGRVAGGADAQGRRHRRHDVASWTTARQGRSSPAAASSPTRSSPAGPSSTGRNSSSLSGTATWTAGRTASGTRSSPATTARLRRPSACLAAPAPTRRWRRAR